MRRELMLILVVIAVAAVFLYKWPGGSVPFRSTQGPSNLRATTPPGSTEASPKKGDGKASRGKGALPVAGRDRPRLPERSSGEPATAPVAPAPEEQHKEAELPFPTSADLKPGTTTTEIRARFGPPSFDIAGSSAGRVLERYYYVDRRLGRLSVVTIENGLLTSVDNLSSPYFQLPGIKDRPYAGPKSIP
jgi:hypothetical protein